jgi:uncharacterized protein YjbI with pentapeptide repeats
VAAEGAPQSGVKMFLFRSLKRAFVGVLLSIALLAGQGSLAPATPAYGLTINGLNIGPGANLVNADLKGAGLARVNLKGADLRGADLSRASLVSANLTDANLTGANLSGAILSSAVLTSTNFKGANLTNANLVSAKLSEADFTDANMTGANLRSSKGTMYLKGATLERVKSGGTATPIELPSSDWHFLKGQLVGPGADLNGSNFDGENLSGFALQGASFYQASLVGANLFGANLKNSMLGEVNFSESDLQEADLSGARISSGSFFKANLSDADLSSAELTEAYFGYALMNGANLSNSSVEAANFTDALFSDLVSIGVLGTPTYLPSGWLLQNGSFLQELAPKGSLQIIGEAKLGQLLTVESTWESSVILSYKWMRNGAPIEGANQATYRPGTLDFGKTLTVSVGATKPGHELIEQTLDVPELQIGSLSKSPNPKVNGAFKVGQTLRAVSGDWEDGVTLSYLWIRDGALLANPSNSSSYTLTAADLGKRISLQVTGSLAGFTTVNRVSVASKVLTGTMNVTTPKISGTAKSGSTLKVTTSAWVEGSKITYQWLSNGAVIKGATSSSFKLTTTYKGKKISVKVTQAATGYTTAVKASASVTVSK